MQRLCVVNSQVIGSKAHKGITDIGSKSFIKSQNCRLVDRSELLKLLVWFMMKEKL